MVWDPNITQRVLAQIDRGADPHLAIDILREEVYRMSGMMRLMDKDIRLLQEAERNRLTQTGVWTIVQTKMKESTYEIGKHWMKWAVRGILAVIGTSILVKSLTMIHL